MRDSFHVEVLTVNSFEHVERVSRRGMLLLLMKGNQGLASPSLSTGDQTPGILQSTV